MIIPLDFVQWGKSHFSKGIRVLLENEWLLGNPNIYKCEIYIPYFPILDIKFTHSNSMILSSSSNWQDAIFSSMGFTWPLPRTVMIAQTNCQSWLPRSQAEKKKVRSGSAFWRGLIWDPCWCCCPCDPVEIQVVQLLWTWPPGPLLKFGG